MTLEEYKQQPFKTDGNGNEIPISEVWDDLSRQSRREIARMLKKGKKPDIVDYL